jgi:hypothetical protein
MIKEFNINTYKHEFIVDRLKIDFNDEELMCIWNEIDSTRDCNKSIYQMKELNYILRKDTPANIVRMTNHKDFDLNHFFIYWLDLDKGEKLHSALVIENIPYFSFEDVATYLINTNSKKLLVYENELRDYFLNELFLSDKDDAQKVLDNLMAFGMVDIIRNDWNKIYGLIQKLIH